ncbi:chromate transporter [Clostridium celatum]|uniref:Chromate transport protein n=1 Tax=Clostridium celatum DSM 1785 TaxID=545697 RepID=L1QIE1_9CLOT|nr:chromate transporter [Clostridium celatum]EKY27440.1 chromate transport protein [Clostridium celatum DSM 1785]MCE9654663.1 chromate transporter [Clostridium celatum]MDU2266406.1 chromate transporter [Clostridium celatum]MDU3722219.1 chromate transporter [Clostridium celatum]MDU6295145.1 chromate transporter [Clostridium celatum]
MKELFDLFWTFCRIGALTFGGGYAMLPLIQKEIVENKKWSTEKEILDYYAVGQCTPGVIAVNTATFIGFKLRGVIGGIVATLGVIFPSIVIILIIASFLQNFANLAIVQSAFAGIRVAVVALIITTVVKLLKSSVKDYLGVIIALATFIISAFFGLSPVYIVIAAGLIGFISKSLRGEKQ